MNQTIKKCMLFASAFLLGFLPMSAPVLAHAHSHNKTKTAPVSKRLSMTELRTVGSTVEFSLQQQFLKNPSQILFYCYTAPLPSACWTLAVGVALIDGPLPIGDFIAAGILIGGLIVICATNGEEACRKIRETINNINDFIGRLGEMYDEAVAAEEWARAEIIARAIENAKGLIDELLRKHKDIVENGWEGNSGGGGNGSTFESDDMMGAMGV